MISNRAVLAMMLVVMVLTIYTSLAGRRNYLSQNEIKDKYSAQSYRDWLSNPDKHPHRMAHYGHFAFRPNTVLSIFDSIAIFGVLGFWNFRKAKHLC
ncbi:MAG: hypothetical protein WBP58_09455 [Chitinophagaceae bacterium]